MSLNNEMINALREVLGLGPLYGNESKRVDVCERWEVELQEIGECLVGKKDIKASVEKLMDDKIHYNFILTHNCFNR